MCVAVVDERYARILRGSAARPAGGGVVRRRLPGRQKTGGWSQVALPALDGRDVEHHLAHVARVLHDLLKVAPYERLLIGCTETMWPRIVEKLHPYVRERLLEHACRSTARRRPGGRLEGRRGGTRGGASGHEEAVLADLRARDRQRRGRGHRTGRGPGGAGRTARAGVALRRGAVGAGRRLPRGDWMDHRRAARSTASRCSSGRTSSRRRSARARPVGRGARRCTTAPSLGPVGRIAPRCGSERVEPLPHQPRCRAPSNDPADHAIGEAAALPVTLYAWPETGSAEGTGRAPG